jgi:rubrerythrin
LKTHPVFSGRCPQCRYQYPSDRLSWHCPICGWND